MSLASKLLSAASSGTGYIIYADEVFATSLYTGTGATATITNDIDLSGDGGMVWIKSRSSTTDNFLFDTNRGALNELNSNLNAASASLTASLTAFNSSGFSVGAAAGINVSAAQYVAWAFKKNPKFFDTRTISHITGTASTVSLVDLGTVGQVMIKASSTTGDWLVWHRSLDTGKNLRLNTTAAQTATNAWVSVSGTTVTLSASAPTATYVLYGWAHDSSSDGIVKCGLMSFFSTTATTNQTVVIPVSVVSLNISGRGGSGTTTQDEMTDPGQPYIEPTYSYYWELFPSAGQVLTYSDTQPVGISTSSQAIPQPPSTPASATNFGSSPAVPWYYNVGPFNNGGTSVMYQIVSRVWLNSRTETNPGQPYIAPTYNYVYTTGQTSTVTVNGQTFNFPGGFGGTASTTNYKISLPGTSQNMVLTGFGNSAQLTYSYTLENGSSSSTLDWETQFILYKDAAATTDWKITDNLQGLTTSGNNTILKPNTTAAAAEETLLKLNSKGIAIAASTSQTLIYLAVRKSNKKPLTAASVFQPIVYTGTNVDNRLISTGIKTDLILIRERNDTSPSGMVVGSRPNGNSYLNTGSTAANNTDADSLITPTSGYGTAFSSMIGVGVGNDGTSKVNLDTTASNHIALAFKQAAGFFDIVSYTGDGVVNRNLSHNLGVKPELAIIKSTSTASTSWYVSHTDADGSVKNLWLNSTASSNTNATYASVLSLSSASTLRLGSVAGATANTTNTYNVEYLAYLFATLPGISKVGSYTGNGTNQTIDCGFTTGARFALIKRTDTTGDWFVFDSARGIVAANDPHLSLNTTAAEVTTDDSIDPAAVGFIVNQVAATNINVTSATYIFFSIA